MNKQKVVLLISDFTYGGAQRQLATLAKALRQRDNFDLHIVYYYPDGALISDLANANVSTACIEKSGRLDFLGFYWQLVKHLREIKPDIIHGYLTVPNLFALSLKPFFPKTKTIWGMRGSGGEELTGNNPVELLLSKVEPFLSQFVDLVINNSHVGKNYYLKKNFPSAKMIVVPNGIDVNRFQPDLVGREQVRQEWGIDEKTILIGLVGRIHPMKDHPNFLEAAALLKKKYNNLFFVCVGSGEPEYTAQMQQLGEQLGLSDCLLWTGGRSDMPKVHNALDIAVSASAYGEGFSNTVGESMACGIPCVVTNVGDSAWIVGDVGEVAPPNDAPALASKIENAISKLPNSNCNTIRQRIVNNFSVAQLAENTEKAFQKLL